MPWVFVYGALMVDDMVKRNGLAAHVDHHQIRFNHRGMSFLEPTFANLEPCINKRAHGVACFMENDLWRKLCRMEISYDTMSILAHTKSGPIECQALTLKPQHKRPDRIPSARYAKLLLQGAKHHGLPDTTVKQYRLFADQGSPVTLYFAPLKKPIFSAAHSAINFYQYLQKLITTLRGI